MSNPTTPEAILARVTFLRDQAQTAFDSASALLETALRDAVTFGAPTQGPKACPTILTQAGLVQLTQLRKSQEAMLGIFTQQLALMQNAVQPAAIRPDGPSESQVQTAVEQLRQMTESLASPQPHLTAADSQAFADVQRHAAEVPKGLTDIGPTVSQARAIAAERLKGLTNPGLPQVTTAPSSTSVTEPSGLPAVEPLRDGPVPNQSATPENSLFALLDSRTSPLLDIFAAAPWLHNGCGPITVGSTGVDGSVFRWYKNTNPLSHQGLERAKLPSGFYGGPERPTHVVLRLKSMILVWSFELEPECISAYLIGLSESTHRWFTLKELSASFTRRILQELRDYVSMSHA